jgi:hypothetical protein
MNQNQDPITSIHSLNHYKNKVAIPQNPQMVGEHIDWSINRSNVPTKYVVPDSILQKNWANNLGIVTESDIATHCFTAGYGRIYHRSTGSLLLLPMTDVSSPQKQQQQQQQQPALADAPLDRSDMMMYSGRLRRFTPTELLRLFGFPSTYNFPPDIPLDHNYKLIGNSINVYVVTQLIIELLLGDEGTEHTGEELTLAADSKDDDDNEISSHPQKNHETVGGCNGHAEEAIEGPILELYRYYRWKMLPNCTGRYTCRDHNLVSKIPPLQLLVQAGIKHQPSSLESTSWKEYAFDLPGRPDRVLVVPMNDKNTVGLITFVKNGGESFVHTLNTPSGFRRKLEAIGIQATNEDIQVVELQQDRTYALH